MDEFDSESIFELLNKLSLPKNPIIYVSRYNFTNSSIQLARYKRLFGEGLLFDTSVVKDPRDSSKNVIVLHSPKLRNIYFK